MICISLDDYHFAGGGNGFFIFKKEEELIEKKIETKDSETDKNFIENKIKKDKITLILTVKDLKISIMIKLGKNKIICAGRNGSFFN